MANFKINSTQWNDLPQDQKDQITKIFTTTGLLKNGSNIEPDANTPLLVFRKGEGATHVEGIFCEIACSVAQASAVAACGLLSGPAVPICIAAATAAGDACRRSC